MPNKSKSWQEKYRPIAHINADTESLSGYYQTQFHTTIKESMLSLNRIYPGMQDGNLACGNQYNTSY